MTPKVFIIIVNYQGANDTVECLKSLDQIKYNNFEVLLVDNHSRDNSLDVLSSFKPETYALQLISSDVNNGFGAGCNLGIKKALEEEKDDFFILLLNNDTTVEPDFLDKLMEQALLNPKYGILGSKIYFYGTKNIWFLGGEIKLLGTKGAHLHYNEQDRGQFNGSKIIPADFVSGCTLLIRSDVIKKIGLINEKYFLYFEDVDWNVKARNSGWLVGVAPESAVYHKVSQSINPASFEYIYYHTRNGFISAYENGNFARKALLYILSFYILAKQIGKMIFKKDKKWEKAIMAGIKDFYIGKYGKIQTIR